MGLIKTLLIVIGLIVVVSLVWGFIGGSQASDIGTTCDTGIGDGETICWSWHKNVIGQVQDGLSSAGNAIKDTLNLN